MNLCFHNPTDNRICISDKTSTFTSIILVFNTADKVWAQIRNVCYIIPFCCSRVVWPIETDGLCCLFDVFINHVADNALETDLA